MENVELKKSVEEFKDLAYKRGDEFIVICNSLNLNMFDTQRGYNYTRVTDAKLIIDDKEVSLDKVTTWASLLRSVNTATKNCRLDEMAIEKFNLGIKNIVEKHKLAMNRNFSMELFDDDSWIHSSVYRNNQNHALEVFDGKKICAVYSGEVIVVLNALIGCCDGNVKLFISFSRKSKFLGMKDGVECYTGFEDEAIDEMAAMRELSMEKVDGSLEQHLSNLDYLVKSLDREIREIRSILR